MWPLILVLIAALHCPVKAFNLSPTANYVFQYPADQRTFLPQLRSSYFGYAINLRTDGLLVSAPRAQTTLELQRKLNETGAIYKCPLVSTSPCVPFVFDKEGNVEADRHFGYYQSRRKQEQWLGMAMDGGSSPNDKLVVCAPKMITPVQSEHFLLHGACYISMSGTAGSKLIEPPVELAPLRDSGLQVLNVDGGKLFYMYGEMGLSAHISENNEEVLIGAPGVYTWKGTVVLHRPRKGGDPGGLSKRDSSKLGRAVDHPGLIEYETHIPRPNLWNQSDDSYFGFAVASGYFGGPQTTELLYAASAPQASQTGEVYVFDVVDYSANLPGIKTIKKLAVLAGSQMGEYFGYTILAQDFNNDGYVDLVVGAPFHSNDGYLEHGCVYYYQNQGHFDFELKAVLSGSKEVGGRFGMSLGRIGDLDNDGYQDLAVGAPFENDGAVYIFSGSAEGLRAKYIQKISAPPRSAATGGGATAEEDQSEATAMFGMSISRGVDVDGNAYNDIAIGAPNAEMASVYRSYPVVKVIATIETDKKELAQANTQVLATVCVHLQPNVENSQVETNLRLKLKLDTKYQRASFNSDKTNERVWELLTTTAKQCQEFEVSVRTKYEYIFRPLELELHYENLNVPSLGDFCENCVAINPTDPTFVITKLIHMSGCALEEKCLCDLRVTSTVLGTVIDPYILGSDRLITFQYDIVNNNELAYLPQIRITKSSQLQFAKVPSNCQTEEETMLCDITRPYLAKGDPKAVVISFDTANVDGSVGELRVSAEVFSSSEESNVNDNSITDVIPIVEFSEIESTGNAAPSLISLDTSGDKVNVTHTISIRNDGPSIVKLMTVVVDVPLVYAGEFVIPRALINFHRITAKAHYNNRDLSVAWTQNDTILIQNPTESLPPVIADELDALKYDNYKLGFPEFEIPDQQQQEQLQNEQVFRRRRRREIELEENAKSYNIYTQRVLVDEATTTRRAIKYSYDDVLSNRTITFDGNDCDVHQCVQLEVTVGNFRPSRSADVVIAITMEIDLLEVEKLFNEKRDSMLFRLGLRLKKEGDAGGAGLSHKLKLPYTMIVITILKSVPIWVYVMATIFSLLVLTLLTYGLYKCGFFRREKREELAKLTQQSKIDADETDDD